MIVWRWVGRDASGVFLIHSRGNSSVVELRSQAPEMEHRKKWVINSNSRELKFHDVVLFQK